MLYIHSLKLIQSELKYLTYSYAQPVLLAILIKYTATFSLSGIFDTF